MGQLTSVIVCQQRIEKKKIFKILMVIYNLSVFKQLKRDYLNKRDLGGFSDDLKSLRFSFDTFFLSKQRKF